MKKQLSKLRRFFARTGARKLDATATREAIPVSYDDDDGSTRLSGAFIIVLILHVVALLGVFIYSRNRENNVAANPPAITPGKLAKTAAPAVSPKAPAVAPEVPSPVEPVRAPESDLPPLPTGTPPVRVGRQHIVKSGETLTRIAVFYSISKADLATANGIRNENELRTGQELVIPTAKVQKQETKAPATQTPPKPVKPTSRTYTVKKGDNLMKIANTYDVKYEDLVKVNGIKDPKKLREGQTIKLPAK